jgi:hypothetical protein
MSTLEVVPASIWQAGPCADTWTIFRRTNEFDATGFESSSDFEERVRPAPRDALDNLEAFDCLNADA